MNMYYVAIVAPAEIDQQIVKWKSFFREHYNCLVGLKSPAHITLLPPFWMKDELEAALISDINKFSGAENRFEITLTDFGAFKPKTIFVDVKKSERLNKFHDSFTGFIDRQHKYPIKKDDRPFHPHVTLATRDLHKKAFYEAWEIFSIKKYGAIWSVTGVSLLRHNKKNWDVIFTSQLED